LATKEPCLRESAKVSYRGTPNVPFYEVGVVDAVEQLQRLIESANRGRLQ
jgi:hypothetical protein